MVGSDGDNILVLNSSTVSTIGIVVLQGLLSWIWLCRVLGSHSSSDIIELKYCHIWSNVCATLLNSLWVVF